MSLPVIQRPIDNTAMSAYMACPREYKFSMVEHRRQKGKSAALTFGSAWHKVLEMHYRGLEPTDALEQGLASWEGHDSPEDYRTPERIVMDFRKYLKQYPEDRDRPMTVGYPHDPIVEIAAHAESDEVIHPYAGKLDRPYIDGEYLYIEDHKTTSRLDKNYFLQFDNSNQMRGYTWLGKQLFPSYKVVGVRINLIHVTKTKIEFHRQIITFTKDQIKEWAENYNRWAFKIALDTLASLLEEGADEDVVEQLAIKCRLPMDAVRFQASLGTFAGHYGDNGCSRKYGLCVYHRVCAAGRHVRERMLENEFEVNPWNPLEVDDE